MRKKELPMRFIQDDIQDYKKGLEEEYDELQKEIFSITLQV